MFNLGLSQSRLSLSPSQKTSSSSSSSSSRPSALPSFHRSCKSDLERQSSDIFQNSLTSSSLGFAEDMDDDNVSWGPVSRKKRLS